MNVLVLDKDIAFFPDVHGDLDSLYDSEEGTGCLVDLGVFDAEGQVLDDISLVGLGDDIHRGPQDLETLDFLADLRNRLSSFVSVCGNHDLGWFYYLNSDASDNFNASKMMSFRKKSRDLFKSLKIEGLDYRSDRQFFENEEFGDLFDYLYSKQLFVLEGNILAVHGGVDFGWAERIALDGGVDLINTQFNAAMKSGELKEFSQIGFRGVMLDDGMTSPMYFKQSFLLDVLDERKMRIYDALKSIGIDYIVCGHEIGGAPRCINLYDDSGENPLHVLCVDTHMSSGFDKMNTYSGGARFNVDGSFFTLASNGDIYTSLNDLPEYEKAKKPYWNW